MTVAPKTLEAAGRWLHFLRNGSLPQAKAFLEHDPSYMDLTRGQYLNGLELLNQVGACTDMGHLRVDFQRSTEQQARLLLASSVLASDPPVWLDDPFLEEALEDPPAEARGLLDALEVGENRVQEVIRRAYGKVDLESRAAFGAAGERAIIELLERSGAERVEQVSEFDDGAGFDIRMSVAGTEFHLEVKATTKRRSLRLFLSRNEFETALVDSQWRLIVVGLDDRNRVGAIGTLDRDTVAKHVPIDRPPVGSWASSKMVFKPGDITRGLQLATLDLDGHEPDRWWT